MSIGTLRRCAAALVVVLLTTSACASDGATANEEFCSGIPGELPQVMEAPGSVWLNPPVETVAAVKEWFAVLPVSGDQEIQVGIDNVILDLEAMATGGSGPTESLSVDTAVISSLINEACGLDIGPVRMTSGT